MEEADFVAQLNAASFWGGDESDHVKGVIDKNSVFSFSLGHSFPTLSHYPFVNNNTSLMAMDFCMLMDDEDKRKPQLLEESSQRSKKLKKCVKVDENGDDDSKNTATNNTNNVVLHRQSSSGFCSEEDSNGGQLSSSSKRRASRGSATDPQSLYARKRRERINERLKILQTLVPNGTKVDISTMLEEAVQYVKFLQLQIKLLSSDEMWMYAPIAYNGMDIGLDFKIPSPKQPPS